jgi:TIR domain-containing protein
MPRVFISYCHESDEHKARTHALADRLRSDGVTVVLDRDCGPAGPSEGWDKWSEIQAAHCEVFLAIFTKSYLDCWEGNQPLGVRLGVTHEAKVLYRRIYEAGNNIDFCRVVVLDPAHKVFIPTLIAGLHYFDASRDYSNLLEWLRGLGAVANVASRSGTIISWPEQLPEYAWELADRVREFKLFESMVTGHAKQRILLFKGPSNSGKTALLTELFRLVDRLGLNHAQFDLKGCPSLSDLFDRLALDLSPTILPAFHSAVGGARKTALLTDLQNLSIPLVLGFDTFQDASTDAWDWIEGQLLERADKCPGFIIVLSGQKVPEPSRHRWGGMANLCELPPIKDVRDWHNYACRTLGSTGLTPEHVEMLVHIHNGDPGLTSSILRTFAPSANAPAFAP